MGDAQTFDFDRSTQQAWDDFADRLGEVLSMMDDESMLRISTLSSDLDPAPSLRFTGLVGQRIRAEASSNASLGDRFQLSIAQLSAMDELGWHSPSAVGDAASPDFTVEFDSDQSGELAVLSVTTLRQVYGVEHPVFLAPDQLAEILQPSPPPPVATSEHDTDDLVAVLPADQQHLDQLLDAELCDVYGQYPFRDSEGDVAIRVGSTMVFVRSTPDAREIVLFSALVHDVAGRSRATEVLNDLNVESRYGRFALHRDRVFVQMSVPAHPFVPAHLHQALKIISQIADGIDDELAARLQGRTTFDAAGR